MKTTNKKISPNSNNYALLELIKTTFCIFSKIQKQQMIRYKKTRNLTSHLLIMEWLVKKQSIMDFNQLYFWHLQRSTQTQFTILHLQIHRVKPILLDVVICKINLARLKFWIRVDQGYKIWEQTMAKKITNLETQIWMVFLKNFSNVISKIKTMMIKSIMLC